MNGTTLGQLGHTVSVAFVGLGAACAVSLIASSAFAQQKLVNGNINGECVFPTAVYIGGCTATLVAPRAITTAQHCSPGPGTTVTFGEEASPSRNPVKVVKCVTGTSNDGAICELESAVTDVPVTPIAFGCEIDKYLKVDTTAWYSGYGQVSYGERTDDKRWAETYIADVKPDYTVIGAVRGDDPDIPSPCPGDSGGPVWFRVTDGSYRVFGTVYQGTTGTPCNGAANFQRVDTIVAAFEAETGVDVTPCFDGATGDWDPSEDCGGFYAAEPGESVGSWSNMCADTTVSGPGTECGDNGAGTGGTSGTGGAPGAGGTDTGPSDPTMPGAGGSLGGSDGLGMTPGVPGMGDGDEPSDPTISGGDGAGEGSGEGSGDESGCSCTHQGRRKGPSWALFGIVLALGAAFRKRRRATI